MTTNLSYFSIEFFEQYLNAIFTLATNGLSLIASPPVLASLALGGYNHFIKEDIFKNRKIKNQTIMLTVARTVGIGLMLEYYPVAFGVMCAANTFTSLLHNSYNCNFPKAREISSLIALVAGCFAIFTPAQMLYPMAAVTLYLGLALAEKMMLKGETLYKTLDLSCNLANKFDPSGEFIDDIANVSRDIYNRTSKLLR